MKKNLTLALFLIFTINLNAQTETDEPSKSSSPSMATINTMNGSINKGWLYNMDSNHIYLLPAERTSLNPLYLKNPNINAKYSAINMDDINSIALQRKNAGAKGALYGFLAGAAIGVIVGFAEGDDKVLKQTNDPFNNIFVEINNAFALTASEKALYYGLGIGGIGALSGFIIGKIVKKKFIIGGKKENLKNYQSEIRQRLMLQ